MTIDHRKVVALATNETPFVKRVDDIDDYQVTTTVTRYTKSVWFNTVALKLIVGAFFQDSFTGAAFIFDADGTNPIKVVSSDTSTFDEFAVSVAIGNSKIAVGMLGADDGGSGSGSAFIYDLDGTNEVKLTDRKSVV